MERFNTKFRLDVFIFSCLAILSIIFFTIPPVPAWGARVSNYTSDLIPPQITVISPLADSVVDTAMPKIEISFRDIGSGIDENTIQLVLDRFDVTIQSIIESTDITGQTLNSLRKITYQPTVALVKGIHQIDFSVRDMAGNLAKLHWNFDVEAVTAPEAGIQFGGSNSYQFDASPIYKNADLLDLTAQGQYRGSSIQLHLQSEIADYPGATPNFSYNGYNFYFKRYSAEYNRRKFSLAAGYTAVSLSSELLQIGLDVKGAVISDTIDLQSGQYNWSIFSGEAGSSFGVGMNVYHITGASAGWHSASDWGLDGFCANIDNNNFAGIKGNTTLGSFLLQYELTHGYSQVNGQSGNGMTLHIDKSVASTSIGLDYFILQPDYPAPDPSATLILTGGGMKRCAIRSFTSLNNGQSININASVSQDNPDQNFTTRDNINIEYHLNPNSGFNFSTNYQGDFQFSAGDIFNIADQSSNQVLISLKKELPHSMLETSISFEATRKSDPSQSFDQWQLFGAWTEPAGIFNLTPSIQWLNQKYLSGNSSSTIDTRLALDKLFHPGLPRSTIALYYQINNDITFGQPDDLTKIGLMATIYIMLWPNSTLYLTGNYAKWTDWKQGDGWDFGFGLSWKLIF